MVAAVRRGAFRHVAAAVASALMHTAHSILAGIASDTMCIPEPDNTGKVTPKASANDLRKHAPKKYEPHHFESETGHWNSIEHLSRKIELLSDKIDLATAGLVAVANSELEQIQSDSRPDGDDGEKNGLRQTIATVEKTKEEEKQKDKLEDVRRNGATSRMTNRTEQKDQLQEFNEKVKKHLGTYGKDAKLPSHLQVLAVTSKIRLLSKSCSENVLDQICF
eukprot:TRINITY_DN29157_c0_g1_i2.p1 TRINITY_DN29157_c0_g1~~TRINITY_DN29157_c0_g1_i2.p1  ORF type:complete len:249 (+),score=53.46 TRINITY_DN29157_c0_g1_i2:87-749(+)